MSHFSSIVAALISDASAVGRDLLSAADAAAQRTLLSVYSAAEADAAIAAAVGASAGATHSNGTLAARPSTPAAGGTYAVTSGAALGDRYTCFVAGAWTLTAYDRGRIGELTPWARWRCDETSGTALADTSGGVGSLALAGAYTLGSPMAWAGSGVRLLGSTSGASGAGTDPPSTRKRTVACWTTFPGAAGYNQTLWAHIGSWGTAYGSLVLMVASGSGVLRVLLGNGATVAVVLGATAPLANVPHLITVEWDGDAANRLTITIDCVVDYNATPAGMGADLASGLTSPAWQIGVASTSERLTGFVREVQVYDGTVLTAAQRRELYMRGVGTYGGQ